METHKSNCIRVAGVMFLFLMPFVLGCGKKAVMTEDSSLSPVMEDSVGIASEEKDSARFESAEKEALAGAPVVAPRLTRPGKSQVSESGLKAGFSDDNKQYGYFIDFLSKYSYVKHKTLDVGERIILSVKDSNDRPVPNAQVTIKAKGKPVSTGKTWADGTFLFFPSLTKGKNTSYEADVNIQGTHLTKTIDRNGVRHVDFTFNDARQLTSPVPLDIVFILDTTGSMGEEILRLKQTIELINLNLSAVSPAPDIRFGMVLYKDKGDEYRTHVIPLTRDLSQFQSRLNDVRAGGGGDTPEDLEAALDDALNSMTWNDKGIRLGFIITDAPPQFYDDQTFTYAKAAMAAKQKAIKLYSVGTGGLPLEGEYVLRQISQFTSAAYIFLTYGEKGESDGGSPGSVSHHSGNNFQTDKLETIIIRFAKNELAHLSDKPLTVQDEYFQAVTIPDEPKDETLKKLFEKAATQLVDYASIEMKPETPTAVLPIVSDKGNATTGEYFTEQMMLALNGNPFFKHVARSGDMQAAEDELALGLSGMVDESNASEVGNFIGADLLITGKLYPEKGAYNLFFRLIRVETAEVLSVTKLVIDKNLGLAE